MEATQQQVKKKRKPRTNIRFTGSVINKKTKEVFWIQMDTGIFSRLSENAVVKVHACAEIKHIPSACFTKFSYRTTAYLRGFLNMVRSEPRKYRRWEFASW